uniref:AsmA-like C-terminal domain-containing protein n=1 Tax=Bosea sp. NBC_00436 TaxID=2969620 RepID=A0A9E7ZYA4_9HYPH
MIVARPRRTTHLAGTALAFVLMSFAAPAWAADFQLDNVKIDLGKLVINAPKIAIKGSTLEKDAFLALFTGASASEPAAARAAKLNAAEISAPELSLVQTVGDQKQTTVYRDIRLTDIREGKIGHGESASGSITADGAATGPMKGELKRTAFDAFDLRQIARVLTEKAAAGTNEAMLPIIGNFEQDGYNLDMGKAGKMSLGRTTARGFAAKVGPEPLLDVFSRLAKASEEVESKQGDKKAKDAEKSPAKTDAERQLGLSMLALFDMFEYGSGEARDLVMNISAPPKAGAKAEAVDMRIARMAFGENTPAKSGFAMEGLQFRSGEAKGGVDSISYSGFKFGSVIGELRAVLNEPDKPIEEVDFRRFIPTLGTVRLAGISIDAPAIITGKEPVKISLGSFEIKAGEQLNGIPTSLAVTIDKLVTPVSEATGNPAAKDMIAMGIRSLDLSAKLDLAWEAAKNEIAIRTLSFGSAGLAQIEASGTLGNVTKDLFASDLALAQVAALGATARNLQVKVQNFGLVEKLIENEARKSKRKADEVRQQFTMVASLGLAAILGPSDGAKSVAAAASRFVAKPGTLTVAANAKSATGLGLADVITMTEPTEIFDKIDLKADAQ